MNRYKGLLFDLDGVLVDTAKYHFLAWKRLAEELGIPFTEQDNERLKGVSRMRSFEIILEIGGVTMDAAQKEAMCAKKNAWYVEYISQLQPEELFDGVHSFLTDARQKGYKLALGSASKNSRIILERLKIAELLDTVVDGTLVGNAKPDPEVFLKGAELLDLAPVECVVFEDAAAGVEAAHRGGMPAVGIGTQERLPKADIVIPGFVGVTADMLTEKLAAMQRQRV